MTYVEMLSDLHLLILEKTGQEYVINISAGAVEKTDTDSFQRRTEKLHKRMRMSCKSRCDKEMRPRESPISCFLYCEKTMKKENKSIINTDVGKDSSFPHR